MIDAISTYINGNELDRVSILDARRLRRHRDQLAGAARLWRAGRSLCARSVRLNTRDADRPFGARALRNLTAARWRRAGDRHRAGHLIADETIRFYPALPEKVDAGRGLPLGIADKLVLALDEPEAPPQDGDLRGATMRLSWHYHLRPLAAMHRRLFRRPLCASSWRRPAGAWPRRRSTRSPNSSAPIARKLKPLAESDGRTIRSPGSYSHALPGHAGDRAELAPRRRAAVLCRRGDLAELFLDRAWGTGYGGAGGGRGDEPRVLTLEHLISVKFQVMRVWIKCLVLGQINRPTLI